LLPILLVKFILLLKLFSLLSESIIRLSSPMF
jgi:hypothetical protein